MSLSTPLNLWLTPRLIVPPAVEPVSLPEMKAWLRLDGAEEDATLTALIGAARRHVEAASGRLLIAQTWRITLDAWPTSGVLRLPFSPVTALAAARVFDAAGVPTALALSTLTLDVASDPPRIAIGAVPAPGRVVAGIEIDVVAGFGPAATDTPAPLRLALRQLVARWFDRRGDDPAARAAAIPDDVGALIAPFRRARL